jgi:hypothetical protein
MDPKIAVWFNRPWRALLRANLVFLGIILLPILGDLIQGSEINWSSRYCRTVLTLFIVFNTTGLYYVISIAKQIKAENRNENH